MSNKQKTTPLMYIVQPEYNDVRAQMQAFVVKKPGKEEKSIQVENKTQVENTVEELSIREAKEAENDLEIAKQNEEPERKIEEKPSRRQRKKRKPLSKMSIAEKVEFFTTMPKNMAKSLCFIKTIEGSYRGVIMAEQNGIVTIRSLNEPKPLNIPLENIKGIDVLGF
ncbi:CotO family spore coat protein [Metabacillus arenae]|uniref:Spore coat protein CotO n=1 Tax=Metabacillus arenae TaxID=2771434 RepID=A0A926S2D5_9BACI|nr:CotO family spore coat protein [Metabacillus arenae]MBD1381904.1 hypothetical protein [Metabacillus arenae]